jgi:hypothetical protein
MYVIRHNSVSEQQPVYSSRTPFDIGGSLIPQEYSWGRFCITDAAFQMLIKSATVFAEFLDIVAAYGVKSSEDERVFYGWRSCALRKQCLKERHGKYAFL